MKKLYFIFLIGLISCLSKDDDQKIAMIENWTIQDVSYISFKCLSKDCGEFMGRNVVVRDTFSIEKFLRVIDNSIVVNMSSQRSYTKIAYDIIIGLRSNMKYEFRLTVSKNRGSYLNVMGEGVFKNYIGDFKNDSFEYLVPELIGMDYPVD